MSNSVRRRGRLLALIPVVGVLFWLTALMASTVPSLLVLGVNVHGLTLAGYAGESDLVLAPLSQRIIGEARDDTARAAAAVPTASANPTVAGAPGNGTRSAGTPTATPTTGGTSPGPSASTSPTIAPLPSILPSITPLPSIFPSATPAPTLSPTPSPTPTATPTPTPTATPTPVSKGTILGQVTDTVSHLPVVGANVTLSSGGTTVATALTDINGNFTFDVNPGSYIVTGSAAGYNSSSQTVSVSGGGRVSVTIKLLSLTATGGIKGTVTNNAKQPVAIAGAVLTLSNGLSTVTDIYGNFSFPVLPYGTYSLTASAPGYISQTQSVTVLGGHVTPANFALAP